MVETGFVFRADHKVYQIYKCLLAIYLIGSWLAGVVDAWCNLEDGRYYTGIEVLVWNEN